MTLQSTTVCFSIWVVTHVCPPYLKEESIVTSEVEAQYSYSISTRFFMFTGLFLDWFTNMWKTNYKEI